MLNSLQILKTNPFTGKPVLPKGHKPNTDPDNIKGMTFEGFNEIIGLPIHPHRNIPLKLTPAQMSIYDSMRPGPNLITVNKGRQIGITEAVLRILLYLAITKHPGKLFPLVMGTNSTSGMRNWERLYAMIKKIPNYVDEIKQGYIKLTNGAEIQAFPANVNAVRGWSKLGGILLDESAFWGLVDDLPVLNTILPIAKTNQADLFSISTPNGTNNFHYLLSHSEDPLWTRHTIDFDRGAEGLYTKQEKQYVLSGAEHEGENVEQEYYCKFITDRDSFFGVVGPENMEDYEVYDLDDL